MLQIAKVFFAAAIVSIMPAATRDFSGFFVPESVQGRQPPYVPVSTTATLEIGSGIEGILRFREIGEYRLEGVRTTDSIEITLYAKDGKRAGRGRGRLTASRLEAELELGGAGAGPRSTGRLTLDAAARWRASWVMKEGEKLQDPWKRPWYAPDFDDRDWEEIELPDDDSFGDEIKHKRHYRTRFYVERPTESLSLVFSSDDGIWIYVNGRFLGHWGARENKGGCVNDSLERCGINGTVPPVPIPESFLREGENIIAVKVNNGVCCFNYFNLIVERVSARFIPITR